MGVRVKFCIMAGMSVLMRSMLPFMFMIMRLGLSLVCMLMQMFVEVFMGVFMRMLVAVFNISMGMFVLVCMDMRMPM